MGQMIMVQEYDPTKIDMKKHRPYFVVSVHTNKTLVLQISQHVQERFNVRKISPYRGLNQALM